MKLIKIEQFYKGNSRQKMRRMSTSAHSKKCWYKAAKTDRGWKKATDGRQSASGSDGGGNPANDIHRDQSEAQLAAINRVTRNDGANQPQAFSSQRASTFLRKTCFSQVFSLTFSFFTVLANYKHTSCFVLQQCVKDAACPRPLLLTRKQKKSSLQTAWLK